jgi:hypothetical protein
MARYFSRFEQATPAHFVSPITRYEWAALDFREKVD